MSSTPSSETLATPVAVDEQNDAPLEFSDRLKARMAPETLESEEFENIVNFIQQGGRLRAIDYTKTSPEQKEEGFCMAREYLHEPMYSVIKYGEIRDDDVQSYHHPNPNNPAETFAPIQPLSNEYVEYVMSVALDHDLPYVGPSPDWDGPENFRVRQEILDRFLASVYQDRHTYAGLMALCQGKTGFEVYRDMQEHFDFWREYREVKEAMSYEESLLRSNGDTTVEYRPIDGVVGVWQPFNFSCIGIGDTSAALLMGNSVVIHTSARNVGTYKWLFDKLREAGVPANRVQFVIPNDGPDMDKVDHSMSSALAAHPDMHLIQFTGSHKVAKMLYAAQAKKVQETGRLDYKFHAEASGYNPFIITGLPEGIMKPLHDFFTENLGKIESEKWWSEKWWDAFFAKLQKEEWPLKNLVYAVVDSVTGLQAHKCSTCKEFIVALDPSKEHHDPPFLRSSKYTDYSPKGGVSPADAHLLKQLIMECLKRVKIGPIENGGVDMGGLIDAKMHSLVRQSLRKIVEEGGRLLSADTIDDVMTVEGSPQAMNVAFYDVPKGNLDTMDKVEIFAPVVRWNEVEGVDAAVARASDLGYALTATVLAPTATEARAIRSKLPHGVVYISDEDGSIDGCTGAPAPQIPFGGYNKSGTGSSYRPGNSMYPLSFTQKVARPRCARANWGKGLHPAPTADVLDSMARRDPQGVIAWVRENVKQVEAGTR